MRTSHRRFPTASRVTALITACFFIVSSMAFASGGQRDSVPPELMAKLKKGVNIARWFCYLKDPLDSNHLNNYLTDKDFDAFKKLQISWVRLCVSPEAIYRNGRPDQTNLECLDRALGKLQDAGLAVVLDLHDEGKMQLGLPGHDDTGLVTFWQQMSRHYAHSNELSLIFELVNEPQFRKNPDAWNTLQNQAVAAIREIDPLRTIVVSPSSWSSIASLKKLQPLADRNVIYTVHSYDPFFFTHQATTWNPDPPKGIQGLPFPATLDNIGPCLAASNPADAEAIRKFAGTNFDEAALKANLANAKNYGTSNGVNVILGEFGAFPKASSPESRAHWLETVRKSCDDLGLPYAIWAYDDSFGLARKIMPDGSLYLDPVALKAVYGVTKL